MSLSSAKLRHQVTIQQKTESVDSITGVRSVTWSNLYTKVRCSIEPLSVKDFLQSRAHQSEVTVRITTRWRSGLDSTQRIMGTCSCHSGKIYNPEGWLEDPVSGLEYVTAPCSEGINNG